MRLNIDLIQGKNKNVFFTSDFHCFHQNVIRFDSRPFSNLDEMHLAIEEGWNEVVGKDDIVIYNGDLSFARAEDKPSVVRLLNRLNGTIHFVLGNHDKIDEIKKIPRFASINDYLEVRIAEMTPNGKIETLFCCMHYPIREWNKTHHGSYMIHGHSHMALLNSETKWLSEMNEFAKYIPEEDVEEFTSLINKHYLYNKRIFDVGCMGTNYKPISYKEIIKLGRNKEYGIHH